MIELRAIHVTFNAGTPLETRALRGVDLAIEEGEFVTLIGSNGAGKSTLLSTLTGDVRPLNGSVWMAGRVARIRATRKSFQTQTPIRIATAAMPGRASGRTTNRSTASVPAPSTRAASSTPTGSAPKKLVRKRIDIGIVSAA